MYITDTNRGVWEDGTLFTGTEDYNPPNSEGHSFQAEEDDCIIVSRNQANEVIWKSTNCEVLVNATVCELGIKDGRLKL